MVGPSFDCGRARDPVGSTICADAGLRRLDLEFVQAYQALRHQLTEEQRPALRQDAVTFNGFVIQNCALPRSGVPDAATMARATTCVAQAYRTKRQDYARWLQGETAEEAGCDIGQHLALQNNLAQAGLLGTTYTVDGVYGASTREGIARLQTQCGLNAPAAFA